MKNLLILFLLFLSVTAFAQNAAVEYLSGLPYDKYMLSTEEDTITFYLSVTSREENLPLVVYIQGSGMNSLFAERGGRVVPVSGHMAWFTAGQEKYRILIVEKPGVSYLQTGSSASFDRKFSLDRWSRTIVEAIGYVTLKEKVDPEKILVAGHSEGGVVASRVAALLGDKVSHVAVIAGEGPSQLYSLYKLAENGTFFNTRQHNMPVPEQRLGYLTDQWKDILSDPLSTEKKFWGFTYLRWSGFLSTSVIDELIPYQGKILIVQGTSDEAVYPESAVVSYTTLLSKGKDIEMELISNADHSFNIHDQPETDGWRMMIEKVMLWFNAEMEGEVRRE